MSGQTSTFLGKKHTHYVKADTYTHIHCVMANKHRANFDKLCATWLYYWSLYCILYFKGYCQGWHGNRHASQDSGFWSCINPYHGSYTELTLLALDWLYPQLPLRHTRLSSNCCQKREMPLGSQDGDVAGLQWPPKLRDWLNDVQVYLRVSGLPIKQW